MLEQNHYSIAYSLISKCKLCFVSLTFPSQAGDEDKTQIYHHALKSRVNYPIFVIEIPDSHLKLSKRQVHILALF